MVVIIIAVRRHPAARHIAAPFEEVRIGEGRPRRQARQRPAQRGGIGGAHIARCASLVEAEAALDLAQEARIPGIIGVERAGDRAALVAIGIVVELGDVPDLGVGQQRVIVEMIGRDAPARIEGRADLVGDTVGPHREEGGLVLAGLIGDVGDDPAARAQVPFAVQRIDEAVGLAAPIIGAVEAIDAVGDARLHDVGAVIQGRHLRIGPEIDEAELQAIERLAAEARIEDLGGVDRAAVRRPLQRRVDRGTLALAVQVRAEHRVARQPIGRVDTVDGDGRAGGDGQARLGSDLPVAQAWGIDERAGARIDRRGENPLEARQARASGRRERGEGHERARRGRHGAELRPRVATVHQQADIADPGFPAIADQQRGVGIEGVGLLIIDAARERGDGETIEIEGAPGHDIDLPRQPGLDLVGRARLVDVDALDQVGRHVLQREGLSGRREDVAAVQGRQRIGQAANLDARRFALAAIGDLDAGDALQRLDHVIVGQLADILGDHRVDDLGRIATAVDGSDDRGAYAGDHDVLAVRILHIRIGGGASRRVLDGGLSRIGLRESRCREQRHGGNGYEKRQFGRHLDSPPG